VAGVAQQAQDLAAPERVIAFKATEKDFERAICDYLLGTEKDYTVTDIFDKVEMDSATAIYLPMYLFEGKYEAIYNCDIEYTTKGDDGKKWTSTERKGGTIKSNYALLCLAYEGQEIPDELAHWTQTFPYDPLTAQPFRAELITGEGYQILPHNRDRETTWYKWGAAAIKEQSEEQAIEQIPDKPDLKIKNYNSSFVHDEKHEGRMILVPFRLVNFTYENKKYFVTMDGTGEHIKGSDLPQDKEALKQIEINKKKDKRANWIAWPIAVLLFIFTPSFIDTWIIMFAIRLVILIVVAGAIAGILGGESEKNILKKAYKKRKEGYDKIINSLN